MKVYISGKIGEDVISDATFEKFARASVWLRYNGFEVFNPCNEAWQRALVRGYRTQSFDVGGLPANTIPFYDYVLLRDLMALSVKDAIFLLSDWEDSPGAKNEFAFAQATKKRIFFEDRVHAVQFLEDQWKESNKTVKTRCPRHKYVDMHLNEILLKPIPVKKINLIE